MFPSTSVARLRLPIVIPLLVVLVAVSAACTATFDPSGPCTTDGRAAGAYPELEALVPEDLDGRPPTRLDSGRSCTAAALGSLATHGVTELRFAGSSWDTGPNAGVSIAILDASGLKADWVHEFYRLGAEAGRNTEEVSAQMVDVDGGSGYRVDTLNGESYQTVVNWQDGDRVRVVLVASFIREVDTKAAHDRAVLEAISSALGAQDNR